MDEQNASTVPESATVKKDAAEFRGAGAPLENARIRQAATADAISKIAPVSDASEDEEAPPATFAFAVDPEEIESAPEPAIVVSQPAVQEPVVASAIRPAPVAPTPAVSIQTAASAETASATPFEVIPPMVAAPEVIASDATAPSTSPQEIVLPTLEAVIQESAARNVIPAASVPTEEAVVAPPAAETNPPEAAVIETATVEPISSEATIAEARAPEITWFEATAASAESSAPAKIVPEINLPDASAVETPAAESAAPEIVDSSDTSSEIVAPEIVAPKIATPENAASVPNVAESKAAEAKPAAEKTPAASENSKALNRPFRVKLRGSVLVLVRLPNRRDVRAAIHQLSTSGGVIHLEKPLDEKIVVDLIFHLGGKTIREKAQMLFPMWATQGWMQPFRFTQLSEADRQALDGHLKTFISGDAAKSAAAGS